MVGLEDKLTALKTMSATQLSETWVALFGATPPRYPAELLRLGIAYRLQEKASGRRRRTMRIDPGSGRRRSAPRLGTEYVRSWNGRTIAVAVCEDGYRWEERTYASLSAIAREVTGAHWSGPRFFGVPRRG